MSSIVEPLLNPYAIRMLSNNGTSVLVDDSEMEAVKLRLEGALPFIEVGDGVRYGRVCQRICGSFRVTRLSADSSYSFC
jgi:hypothetical protein